MPDSQAGLGLANQQFSRLIPYAPTVQHESMAHRPDVAGRFDPESQSVKINDAASLQLNTPQLAGLISLERARGMLASPLGQQFVNQFPLPDDHRAYWDKMYLPPSVDAPTNQQERDKILKSTILSRLLVGDTMPEDAPLLNEQQRQIGDLFTVYARGHQ